MKIQLSGFIAWFLSLYVGSDGNLVKRVHAKVEFGTSGGPPTECRLRRLYLHTLVETVNCREK